MRRHPHVFSDGDATTPAEVERAWERIKAWRRRVAGGGGGRGDLLHGIPPTLPGDLAADKVLARLRRRDARPATPDAVARLEQARAALRLAEAEVRAALAALAGLDRAPAGRLTPTTRSRPGRIRAAICSLDL